MFTAISHPILIGYSAVTTKLMWNWWCTKVGPPPSHWSTTRWEEMIFRCLTLAFVSVKTKHLQEVLQLSWTKKFVTLQGVLQLITPCLFGKHNSLLTPINKSIFFLWVSAVSGCHCISWSLIIFYNFFFWGGSKIFRVSLPKPILVLRIVKYSTISMLVYIKDTLTNVVIPEDWIKCESNDLTLIFKNCVKGESDPIRQNLSQILSKTVSQIGLGKLSRIQLRNLARIKSVNLSQIPSKNLSQIESEPLNF